MPDAILLTHGAGSNKDSPLLQAFDRGFTDAGVLVQRVNLSYRQARPTGPPPRGTAEADRAGLRAALGELRARVTGRLFVGGHSYGGRQASMLVASEPSLVDGLLLLSYPLHPPRKPEELRVAHFPDLRTSAFFVHGSRDPFGSLSEMEEALKLIPAATQLHALDGVGHELSAGSAAAVASEFLKFAA